MRTGATKAICGGNERPGIKLAESQATFTNNAGANDFCLLHLDRSVPDVPIYEVAVASDVAAREDAIIVGYVRVPSFDSVPLPHFGGVLACTMAPA